MGRSVVGVWASDDIATGAAGSEETGTGAAAQPPGSKSNRLPSAGASSLRTAARGHGAGRGRGGAGRGWGRGRSSVGIRVEEVRGREKGEGVATAAVVTTDERLNGRKVTFADDALYIPN